MPSLRRSIQPVPMGYVEEREEDEMKRTLPALVAGCSAVLVATGAALFVPAAAPALARGHGGSTTTTTMPTTTTTTTTTTAPLSDSGVANCASDGGTESAGVCSCRPPPSVRATRRLSHPLVARDRRRSCSRWSRAPSRLA